MGVALAGDLAGYMLSAALRYTRFGRHGCAIGSNEQTALLCAVPIDKTKLLIFTLGTAFTGLAGVLQFSCLTLGDPATAPGCLMGAIIIFAAITPALLGALCMINPACVLIAITPAIARHMVLTICRRGVLARAGSATG